MRPGLASIKVKETGFNPRICKRCDVTDNPEITGSSVSIHASVKDATGYYIDTFLDMDVSIHASVKDAT